MFTCKTHVMLVAFCNSVTPGWTGSTKRDSRKTIRPGFLLPNKQCKSNEAKTDQWLQCFWLFCIRVKTYQLIHWWTCVMHWITANVLQRWTLSVINLQPN